jgi:diacylglycerol kinase family enzyme
VQNTAPWTYFGDRAVNPCPHASFDSGLDLLAIRRLRTASTVRVVRQILSKRPDPHGRDVLLLHDQDEFVLVADGPMALQVDGDYVGEREEIRFASVPEALRVIV